MCIHIYDSYEQTQEKTLRTIFDTIKDGFLSKERQFVKDKKKRDTRDVMHQDNWTEKIEHCEKQTNVRGVFTCLFTKNFFFCNLLLFLYSFIFIQSQLQLQLYLLN